jgi:DMSO/TMAO reductase YedYZ molybdopterin-dependent catalytic subunit
MITPQLYAWKGAKWIRKIEFLDRNRRGFWERRGYSDTAEPWSTIRTRRDSYGRGCFISTVPCCIGAVT